jgi:outer membrane protein TolC
MKLWLFIALATGAANATPLATPLPTPGLLPAAVARPLLDQDPEVAAARADRGVTHQDARIVSSSPYEWNTKLTAQRRRVENEDRYREWNVGVERTLRLPAKADADSKIATALIEQGDARYRKARVTTAHQLLTLWLDWASAEQSVQVASSQHDDAQQNLAIVEKRVKAGDASRLDASLARGELAQQQRIVNAAKTAAATAWARLHARFPGLGRDFSALPAAVPLPGDTVDWRERILAQSDELKLIEAQFRQARAASERARADKVPDPTVGLYTASERGGAERITGVSLSIPFPGTVRTAQADRAVQSVELSRQEVELKRRELTASIDADIANAKGMFDGWEIAEAGAAAMAENVRMTQRAYALGEADLQTLLSARRQAAAAAQDALAARTEAVRGYLGLLISARLAWDLDQE